MLAADEGVLRRAGVGGVGRRAARRPRPTAWSTRRRRRGVHGHRPRAEGSAARDRRGRRSASRSPPRARRRSPAALRPVTSHEPHRARHRRVGRDRARVRARARGARPRPRARRARRRAARGARRTSSRDAYGVDAEVLAADLVDRRRRSPRSRRGSPTSTDPVDLLVNNAGFGTFGQLRRARRRRARSDEIRAQRASRSCGSPTPRSARWSTRRRGGDHQRVVARRRTSRRPATRPTARPRRSCSSFTQAVHEELRGTGVHVHGRVPRASRTPSSTSAPGSTRARCPSSSGRRADQVVGRGAARPRSRAARSAFPGALNKAPRAFTSVTPAGDHPARRRPDRQRR